MTKKQYAEEAIKQITDDGFWSGLGAKLSEKIKAAATWLYLSGWDKSREVLLKESDEFDEWAVLYALGYGHSDEPDVEHINNGARWQHEQDQLKIQVLRDEIQRLKEFEHKYQDLCK